LAHQQLHIAVEKPPFTISGQLNEAVQIVPPDKFHVCAKAAMNRDVFSDELADRQSLKEEWSERVPKAALVELANTIQAKQADSNRKAS
jgi:sulfur relay (sulfurtransferase) complex TusBCD TusD component (DsrE family)